MSSLNIYQGACGGKASYKNRKEAARAATRLKRKIIERNGIAEPIHAYHCEDCHAFHVGHPVGWRRATGVGRAPIKVKL